MNLYITQLEEEAIFYKCNVYMVGPNHQVAWRVDTSSVTWRLYVWNKQNKRIRFLSRALYISEEIRCYTL